MNLIKYILLFSFLSMVQIVSAQDSKLANAYYRSGEYEKAAEVYKRLYDKTRRNDYYYERYISALLENEDFDLVEASIKEEMAHRPDNLQFYVLYGRLYDRQFMPEKAEAMYQKAIKQLAGNRSKIQKLGSSFTRAGNYDMAIDVFQSSKDHEDLKYQFSYQLADLYRRKGQVDLMLDEYLNCLLKSPNMLKNVKNMLQRELDEEGFAKLQTKLYERLTDYPDVAQYPELLMWSFISQKQYDRALRQARALDRQYEENGARVYELATIALDAKAYDTAIKGYEYITTNKGVNTSYYLDAKRGLLTAKRAKITKNYNYTKDDLIALEQEYLSFLTDYGRNSQTALLMKEYAQLQALYMDNVDEAIKTLEELVTFASVDKYVLSNAKIELGDYKLIKGDVWESTLLYSQVDKAFKEAAIGEEARYRNALLSYYIGDFEWAQDQFDILKSATSKLISNDAIDKSVFIMDNMALDTTDVPLRMFAGADLLIYQNKLAEAVTKLDSISEMYPEHSLDDDILYSKAQIAIKKRNYESAIGYFEKIVEDYPEEIKADNALFEMAETYELILENKEKAQELYEKLFLEYDSSTFAVEARKRFRLLRGDEL